MVVIRLLLVAYVILATASESVECVSNGTAPLYIDAGQKPIDVYGLENQTLSLFPPKSLISAVKSKNVSWHGPAKHLTWLYKRLLVTFNKEVNSTQVMYSIRMSEKIHKSKKITLYIGNSPVLILLNITSTIVNLLDKDTVTVCFTLTGSPQPNLSLLHTSEGGSMSVVNETRYNTNGDCLVVRMVSQQDTGPWTIKATNCFGSSNQTFSVVVTFPPTTKVPTYQTSGISQGSASPDKMTNGISSWVYIVIGVGAVILLVLLFVLIYLKFCKKGPIYFGQYVDDAAKSNSWIRSKPLSTSAKTGKHEEPDIALTSYMNTGSLHANSNRTTTPGINSTVAHETVYSVAKVNEGPEPDPDYSLVSEDQIISESTESIDPQYALVGQPGISDQSAERTQEVTVVASGYAVVDPSKKRKQAEACQYSEVDKDRKKELREV
jgi:hypothetical protein